MGDEEEAQKRIRMVHDLLPNEWNAGPISLAHELRTMLRAIADEGSSIDSGGGDGIADLWVRIAGVEYHIQIKPAASIDNQEK